MFPAELCFFVSCKENVNLAHYKADPHAIMFISREVIEALDGRKALIMLFSNTSLNESFTEVFKQTGVEVACGVSVAAFHSTHGEFCL